MKLATIHPSVFVAAGVQVYGKVSIGEGSSLWPNVVIRAECQHVAIGRNSNVQDFTMIHVGYDDPTTIGDFVTVAHHSTVHGCTLGDAVLVGVGAVIMDGAVIGAGSIVAGGAVVPEGRRFEPNSIIAGVPAKAIAQRENARANRLNAWLYHRNAQFYREGRHRAWDGPEFEAWRRAKQAEIDADLDLRLDLI